MTVSRFPLWCLTQISLRGNEYEAFATTPTPMGQARRGRCWESVSDFNRFCQPVPSGGDTRAIVCYLCLCFSKQCEPCSCCHGSCLHSHPQHTTVHSGPVSIRGLSVAVERDDPHAQGWLADVTASVQVQGGGDRTRLSFPSTQGTVVEFSRTRGSVSQLLVTYGPGRAASKAASKPTVSRWRLVEAIRLAYTSKGVAAPAGLRGPFLKGSGYVLGHLQRCPSPRGL